MPVLSSKTLIQAHALFLFTLAVYLTKSPDVVVESDLVFMLGELLQIVRRVLACEILRNSVSNNI